jgi:hypothetical protein
LFQQAVVPPGVATELAALVRAGRAVARLGNLLDEPGATAVIVGAEGVAAVLLDHGEAASVFRRIFAFWPNVDSRRVVRRREDELLKGYEAYCQGLRARSNRVHRLAADLEEQVGGVSWARPASERLTGRFEELVQKPVCVALLGRFSSGKSSLINALLGTPLLPASDLPTTSTVHRIRYGSRSLNVARFKTREALAHDVFGLIAGTTADGVLPHELAPVQGRDRLDQAADALARASDTPHVYRIHQHAEEILGRTYTALVAAITRFGDQLGQTVTFDDREMEDVVWGENATVAVAEVQTFRELPLLRSGLEIVDLPGIDSMSLRHTQVALEVIKEADVVLYLYSAQQPFSERDHHALATLYSERVAAGRRSTVIHCVNKIDTAANPEVVTSEIARRLKEHFNIQCDVIPVSGLLGMCSRAYARSVEPDLPSNDYFFFREKSEDGLFSPHDLLELSNVLVLEDSIDQIVEQERGPLLHEQVLAALQDLNSVVSLEAQAQLRVWSTEETQRRRTIARLLEIAQQYRAQKDRMRQALVTQTSTAGGRAVASMVRGIALEKTAFIEDYREYFGNLAGFMGTRNALSFLDNEVLSGVRGVFERQLDVQAARAVQQLNMELDETLRAVEQFASELEDETFNAISVRNGVPCGRRDPWRWRTSACRTCHSSPCPSNGSRITS